MSDLHVAAYLHASGINTLEPALDLSLKVSRPTVAAEGMAATHSLRVAALKELVTDPAVALILTRQTHVHLWVLPDQLLVKLEPELELEQILIVSQEPLLHLVWVPLVVLSDDYQRIKI